MSLGKRPSKEPNPVGGVQPTTGEKKKTHQRKEVTGMWHRNSVQDKWLDKGEEKGR